MRKSLKIQAEFLNRQRLCPRFLMHGYFTKMTFSVYHYKKKTPMWNIEAWIRRYQHLSEMFFSTNISRWVSDAHQTEIQAGKRQSFHQPYVHSFPKAEFTLLSCTHTGKCRVTSSVFTRPHVKHPPRVLSDPKLAMLPRHWKQGDSTCAHVAAAGNNATRT